MSVCGPQEDVRWGPWMNAGLVIVWAAGGCAGGGPGECRTGVSVPESVRGREGRSCVKLCWEERLCSSGKLLALGPAGEGHGSEMVGMGGRRPSAAGKGDG